MKLADRTPRTTAASSAALEALNRFDDEYGLQRRFSNGEFLLILADAIAASVVSVAPSGGEILVLRAFLEQLNDVGLEMIAAKIVGEHAPPTAAQSRRA